MKRSSRVFGTPVYLNGTPAISMNGNNTIEVMDSIGSSVECVEFAVENTAVNKIKLTATATGNSPVLEVDGTDANIDLEITPKGTGITGVNSAMDVGGEINLTAANKWIGAEAPGGTNFPVASFTAVDNAVNQIDFTASATGNFPGIQVSGTDSNINLQLGAKGTGRVQATSDLQLDLDKIRGSLGDTVVEFVPQASAVNYIQIKNATTGNPAAIAADGTDTNIDVDIEPKGTGMIYAASDVVFDTGILRDTNDNEVIEFSATGSAVNHINIVNAATGNHPAILPAGGDDNVNLDLQGKGTGLVTVSGKTVRTADYSGLDIDDNSTETTMPLVESLKKVTVFNGTLPSSVSSADSGEDEITIGSTADYEVSFSLMGSTAGAGKEMTFQCFESEPGVNISNVTSANPCVVSAPGHNLSNGDFVAIKGVVGTTEVNDRMFIVAGVAGDSFNLQDDSETNIDGSGFTAYSNGGTTHKSTNILVYDKKFVVATDLEMFSGSTIASLTANNTLQFYVGNLTDATSITFAGGSFIMKKLS